MSTDKEVRLPKPTGTNRNYKILIGGFLTFFGCALYQVIISPMINPQRWKDIREKTYHHLPRQD